MNKYANTFVIRIAKQGMADQIRSFLLGFLIAKTHPDAKVIFEISAFIKRKLRYTGIFEFKDLPKVISKAKDTNRKLEIHNYPIDDKFNFSFASLPASELQKLPARHEKMHQFSSLEDIRNLEAPCFMDQGFALQYLDLWPVELTDEFAAMFEFKSKYPEQAKVVEKIKSCPNSIGMHIRRGDFIKHLNGLAIGKEYFSDAVSEIMKRNNWSDADVFVFSNDWKWASKNIKPTKNIRVHQIQLFDEGYPCDEMDMLKSCNALVSSAGGFCRTACFLRNDRTAQYIMPSKHDLIREKAARIRRVVTIIGSDEKFSGFDCKISYLRISLLKRIIRFIK